MQSPQFISEVLDRLREHHGEPARSSSGDPVSGLVETILSQSTSDHNSARAFADLRNAFPSWDDVLQADVGEVASAIRFGGLADQKARTIQRALAAVKTRAASFDPGFLDDLDDGEAMEWLQSIKGVGKKTAACVLLFDLERDVLPVDTHVHRVSRRLGLVPHDAGAGKTQDLLEMQIAPEDRYATHVLMIRHGRATCHAITPACGECVLSDICPFPPANDEVG